MTFQYDYAETDEEILVWRAVVSRQGNYLLRRQACHDAIMAIGATPEQVRDAIRTFRDDPDAPGAAPDIVRGLQIGAYMTGVDQDLALIDHYNMLGDIMLEQRAARSN